MSRFISFLGISAILLGFALNEHTVLGAGHDPHSSQRDSQAEVVRLADIQGLLLNRPESSEKGSIGLEAVRLADIQGLLLNRPESSEKGSIGLEAVRLADIQGLLLNRPESSEKGSIGLKEKVWGLC